MRKRIRYTDEPVGEPRIIEDFLPPPELLTFKEENRALPPLPRYNAGGARVDVANREALYKVMEG